MGRILLVFVIQLLIVGCASLPEEITKTPSHAYQDTNNTHIGLAVQPLLEGRDADTGLLPLADGVDAFTARYLMAAVAERSLDVQYYIWNSDTTGKLLLFALLEAADRGVRVRLLLDDINLAGKDDALSALHYHPNIEIRLFNPFANRRFRAMDFITDFSRVNRRMHNKSFTIDNQVTIVGGRNVGDEYFDADPSMDFHDFDLLAIGDVVNEVSQQFDVYWNSEFAVPVNVLLESSRAESIESIKEKLDLHVVDVRNSVYAEAIRKSELIQNIQENRLQYFWDEAVVLYDDPEKIRLDPDDNSTHLLSKIQPLLNQTQKEVVIISPYFIPGEKGVERLQAGRARGLEIGVLTNSLASTDVPLVHSGYAVYREPLLAAGVELYEMKSMLKPEKKTKSFSAGSRSSLHSKIYVFDRKNIFVGSFNLDPRSAKINTEMGIYVSDTELAQLFSQWWDTSVQQLAYKLSLGGEGGRQRLMWEDHSASPARQYDKEPDTSAWQRIKSDLLSILPVEKQL